MSECIFCKIRDGRIPSDKVYEDDLVLAFRDISPQAPVHVLVIPKKHVARLADLGEEDQELAGRIQLVIGEIARQEGVAEDGFRVVVNNGVRANQTVFHLHYHVLGGRDFTWPPG
ncbi:MAG TPA: histidine triad nucleotide-binding protein [Bacillota bacterium]